MNTPKHSWLKAGIILGLTFFLAIFLMKPIGVSTQFSVATGMLYSAVDETLITENPETKTGYESTNAYLNKSEGKLAKAVANPMNYDFIFTLAIPLGAFAGYLLLKKRDPEAIAAREAEAQAALPKQPTFWNTYFFPFAMGFILLFGARFAGGCTSGHMMSGIMQGSISGYAFAVAVFGVAIPVAILTKRFKR